MHYQQSPERFAQLNRLMAVFTTAAASGGPCPSNPTIAADFGITLDALSSLMATLRYTGRLASSVREGNTRIVAAADGSWSAVQPITYAAQSITPETLEAVVAAIKTFAGQACPSDSEIGAATGYTEGAIGKYTVMATKAGLLARGKTKDSRRVFSAPDGSWKTLPSRKAGEGYRAAFDNLGGVQVAVSAATKGTDLSPRASKHKAYQHALRVLAAPVLTAEQQADAVARFIAERGVTLCPARCAAVVNNGLGLS